MSKRMMRTGLISLVASVLVLFPLSFAQAATDTPWEFTQGGSACANQGQEYLCITNATASPANVYVRYIFADETILGLQYTIPAASHYAINVNGEVGDKFEGGVSLEVYTWNALVTPELVAQ